MLQGLQDTAQLGVQRGGAVRQSVGLRHSPTDEGSCSVAGVRVYRAVREVAHGALSSFYVCHLGAYLPYLCFGVEVVRDTRAKDSSHGAGAT